MNTSDALQSESNPASQNVPFGLKMFLAGKETMPRFNFADAIEEDLFDGTYLVDFLSDLDWWTEVAKALSNRKALEWDPDPSNPELIAFRSKMLILVGETLSEYPAALASTPDFAGTQKDTDKTKGLSMLGSFESLKKHIREFARQTWPEEDLDWLGV